MPSGMITFLPSSFLTPIPWWQVQDGAIIAAGLVQPDSDDQTFPANVFDAQIIAIVPAADAIVRWTDKGDLAPRQAETAARIAVASESLGAAESLHIVSQSVSNDQIIVASMSSERMQVGLDVLLSHGIDPDIIMPVGLVIPAPENGFFRAKFITESVLRSARSIVPDEAAFLKQIVIDTPIVTLDSGQVEAALVAALDDPPINMRTDKFGKRSSRQGISARNWKILAGLATAGLLCSLLLAIATWVKYDRAIARENSMALAAAKKIVPAATNVEDAQQLLNRELSRRGAGGFQVTSLAASTFAILQPIQGVTLREVRSNGDGIFVFTLAASNTDDINQVLSLMQAQRYRVTAAPRQDSGGLTLTDISVRAE